MVMMIYLSVKICDDVNMGPLLIIYKNCSKKGIYSHVWKKSSIVPVHKKEDKQIVNNYRPVSLLPTFAKVFEKILFNSIFGYFKRMVYFVITNQVFDLLIHLSINYFLLFMTFMHLLIVKPFPSVKICERDIS